MDHVRGRADWLHTRRSTRRPEVGDLCQVYLENTLVIDPKYLDDMVVVTHWADIKGYLVPELILQRLMAWEGRTIVSGRRLNDIQLQEVRKKLRTLVRKHSAGFVKGELWPSWPAEAELGIDKQVRGRDDGALQEQGAPRRRSRSRSQSLARAMKEEDEVKKAADREAVVDCDPDEVTGDNIIEAYATATGSGQTHQEAIDTVQMIYEVDVSAIKNVLKSYIKKNCGKQNEQVEIAIKILKGLNGQDGKSSRDDGGRPEVQPAHAKPMERPSTGTPEKLFPVHYGERREEGSLIRPAGDANKTNPLTANDGIVGQLLYGQQDDVSNSRWGRRR